MIIVFIGQFVNTSELIYVAYLDNFSLKKGYKKEIMGGLK